MKYPSVRLVWLFLFFGTLFVTFCAVPILGDDNTGFVTVDSGSPQWTYTGDANNTQVEWEIDGAFTANWTMNDDFPDTYVIYWNQTGSNTTRTSGAYVDGQEASTSYDPVLSDVGNVIFFQLWLNDTFGFSNTSIVFFSVVNTNPPTVGITNPQNDTYTGDVPITLTNSSEDADTCWYAIYYTNDSLHTGNTTWTESVDVSLPTATYYLVAYLNDTAGNEDSETVYFTVDLGGEPPVVERNPGHPRIVTPAENVTTEPGTQPIPFDFFGMSTMDLIGMSVRLILVGAVLFGLHRYLRKDE